MATLFIFMINSILIIVIIMLIIASLSPLVGKVFPSPGAGLFSLTCWALLEGFAATVGGHEGGSRAVGGELERTGLVPISVDTVLHV